MSINHTTVPGSIPYQQSSEPLPEVSDLQKVESSLEISKTREQILATWEWLERMIGEDYESLNKKVIDDDMLASNERRLNELQQIYNEQLQQDPQSASDYKERLGFIKDRVEEMRNALISLQETQIANPGQNALALWEGLEAQINENYAIFLTNRNDVNLLSSTANLSRLQRIYEETYQEDQQKAVVELKPRLAHLEKCVQEMNMSSKQLTSYDLKAIASFSTKPIEDTYVDKNGVNYYQPDHSQLLNFGSTFFMLGEYAAIGLLRQKTINNEVCDILYLSKQEDQISFETPPSRFGIGRLLPKRNEPAIVARKQQQQILLDQAKEQLEKKIIDWNYDKFEFPSPKRLERSGFDPNYVNVNHVLVLYYKKKEIQNTQAINNTGDIYE
ncbi:MAG: hypothetical protein KBA81_07285 [Rhabdochlamydiaceae bacterium]|nr:hypothetical protein [Rhabdochlamydiaceae bacterium]